MTTLQFNFALLFTPYLFQIWVPLATLHLLFVTTCQISRNRGLAECSCFIFPTFHFLCVPTLRNDLVNRMTTVLVSTFFKAFLSASLKKMMCDYQFNNEAANTYVPSNTSSDMVSGTYKLCGHHPIHDTSSRMCDHNLALHHIVWCTRPQGTSQQSLLVLIYPVVFRLAISLCF